MSRLLVGLALYLLASCSAMAVVRDTGLVAGAAAVGALAGPGGAAVGGGGAYMMITASKGHALEADVHDAALKGGASVVAPIASGKLYWLAGLLLLVFFITPAQVGILLRKGASFIATPFKESTK